MAALESAPIVSPYRLISTLVCLLQILVCSGEYTEQLYRLLVDVSYSATQTYATFPGDSRFECSLACNLDEDCKGVFYDGSLCSMVRYGSNITRALPPAPVARFYVKGEYIFFNPVRKE